MAENIAQMQAVGKFEKPIDYVLVHSKDEREEWSREGSRERSRERSREMFKRALNKESISSEDIYIGDKKKVFTLLHCSFERLCEEAERVKLEMPLEGCEVSTREPCSKMRESFETDNEADYRYINISTPFKVDKIKKFKGHENKETFFRPALRALLTHNILINIDIPVKEEKQEVPNSSNTTRAKTETATELQGFDDYCWFWPFKCGKSDESTHNRGLKSLLEDQVYEDAFILHEDSSKSLNTKCICSWKIDEDKKQRLKEDHRVEMDKTWKTLRFWTKRFWKFQPLWKVRNYFGEKIALYFAWAGLLLTSLLGPALFGLICFIYGLPISAAKANEDIQMPSNLTAADQFHWQFKKLYEIVRGAFDNDLTPWFALVICLWGTVFLELWKRKNAVLAYKWQVVNYEANEPDRPKSNIIMKKALCTKFFLWVSTLEALIMVGVISVVNVAVVRLFIYIKYCGDTATMQCTLSSIILPGIGNAVFVVYMDSVYDRLSSWITQVENHDTQTEHNDALIFRLFAYQFANNYASCFYIAFLRGEFDVFDLLGFGEEYSDVCYGGSCISQLSIHVLILMISKPMGKLFKDVIWPPIKHIICDIIWPKIKCGKFSMNKTSDGDEESKGQVIPEKNFIYRNYIKVKVPLEDFTLEEYAEKVTLYGFLMLFASASPLAPLIALGWLVTDMSLDVKRLLWLTRRPVADIAQDIGTWYDILNFVNVLGVISNGFLIAFKSQWGLQYDLTTRMWICIGFQNIVFVIKFFLDYIIPDVPKEVTRAIRRDKYVVSRKMKDSSEEGGKRSSQTGK